LILDVFVGLLIDLGQDDAFLAFFLRLEKLALLVVLELNIVGVVLLVEK
jgi:hypothetical protein